MKNAAIVGWSCSMRVASLITHINFFSMAFSLNRAQIIGNVTREPEVRMAGSSPVATFAVATNFSWTDQSGQRQEKAEFHNVVAWRKLAEICQQYLRKGQKIYIEGRLQTRDWEGEDGVKRYKTEIVAENIIMLDRKGEPMGTAYSAESGASSSADSGASSSADSASSFQPPRQQRTVKKAPAAEPAVDMQEEEVSIDDLPF